jgi:signal transduction histidine kinase
MREFSGIGFAAAPQRFERFDGDGTDDVPWSAGKWSGGTLDLVQAELGADEQCRLARELHEARTVETVGRFAVSIAHDFNSLCTAMIYFAEVANSCVQAGGDPSTVIAHIADAAQSASELSRQILSFTRDQPVEPSLLDLDAALGDLAPLLHCLLGPERALGIVGGADGMHVRLASTHLRQVVLNLLVNAHDATPVGGCITVETDVVDLGGVFDADPQMRTLRPGRYVALRVSDTGDGMDHRTLERCFEPFFTTKGLGHGTGIGLATVRDIAQHYGGTVSVTSAVGRGSTFTVYLPAGTASAEAA